FTSYCSASERSCQIPMRADKLITFVTHGKEEYDDNTGDYVVTDDILSDVYAYVTYTGTERMAALYGGIRQYAKTIRVNEVIDGAFKHILNDGKKYKSDRRKIYRHKSVLEVSCV